jgi:DUF4097 and DUF4098 domain-containing protein YvlB
MALTQPAPPQHRTPVPIRRALLVVAALFAFVAVAWGAFNVLDLAARHATTERATYDGVRALVIEDASDVRLVGAPAGSSLQVVARVTEGLWSPDRSVARPEGGELRLSSDCPVFSGNWCSVDYTIRVPSGTVVRAGASGGDVVAENLSTTQPLELDSSAGDVTAIDITAPSIVLSSSAGDVTARGLSTRGLRAESSAGDVAVALNTVADRLVAESSAGDVEVLVPDAVYNLDATSSAGDVNTRIRSDPASRRELTAYSSAGDVSVAARP